MSLLLDAGAFVALERNDRAMWRRLKAARAARQPPVSHGGVVGQVWRSGSGRQALLARALDTVDIRPLDDALGRAAGLLLGRTRTADAIDAALAALAEDGDVVLTSDAADLATLIEAARRRVDVLPV